MRIAILKERREHELRVAATPDTVKKFIGLGHSVTVESGAGAGASFTDAAYTEAGASIAASAKDAAGSADLVFKVARPTLDEVTLMKQGAVLAALLTPHQDPELMKALAAQGVTAFALELVPRITRAQSMDVLSSQANLAGYRAVIDAAAAYGRCFPMMMTAAGTVAAARCFVMGAGVAGLQAIATARRLGAIVSATDVRPAAKEQVESLGAKFVMVESDEMKNAETAGGYAKEMSEDFQARQAELIAATLPKQDVVITTALIPGRKAPVLVTAEHVAAMKPGSVIVDLAVEQGGNVVGSKPGEVVVTENGVTILGHLNVPSRLAADASSLYAKNILNFATPLFHKETRELALNMDDEIIKGSLVTHGGEIVHPALKGA